MKLVGAPFLYISYSILNFSTASAFSFFSEFVSFVLQSYYKSISLHIYIYFFLLPVFLSQMLCPLVDRFLPVAKRNDHMDTFLFSLDLSLSHEGKPLT